MLPEVLRLGNVFVPEKVWLFARYGITVPSTMSVLLAVRSPPPVIPTPAGVTIAVLLRAIVDAILASGTVPDVSSVAFRLVILAPFAVNAEFESIVTGLLITTPADVIVKLPTVVMLAFAELRTFSKVANSTLNGIMIALNFYNHEEKDKMKDRKT
jgi:hypothetical protein